LKNENENEKPPFPTAAPSELEVMLMSTVSAVPLGDESFEQGRQGGLKACLESRLFQTAK
jgi:hypothetical protein